MTTEAKTMPSSGGGPPKRLLRNFLLDPKFQLKYTGAVVLVTALVTGGVGAWLGYEAYTYSTGMSEMLLMQEGTGEELDDTMHAFLAEQAAEEDAKVLNSIILGIVALVGILSLALGVTGIIITHRIVGPAYKMTLLLGDVAKGRLNVKGGLRKGDELQNVGVAFKEMVLALRERQAEQIAELDAIVAASGESDNDDNDPIVEKVAALRDRLQAALDA